VAGRSAMGDVGAWLRLAPPHARAPSKPALSATMQMEIDRMLL
jgi:hypothetical protein